MAVSTQFQRSLSKALKDKSSEEIKKIEKKLEVNANRILKLLKRKTPYGSNYSDGMGMGVENTVEKSQGSRLKWRKYRREAKDTVSYVFRNDAVYAAGLYGYDKKYWNHPSKQTEKFNGNHPDGFRSGATHIDNRPDQIQKVKWLRFQENIKDGLKKAIRLKR